MKWILNYDLILLDFDGLLVDTEPLHYKAYQISCNQLGLELPWNFIEYCQIAHSGSDTFQKELFAIFPQFPEPWSVFYQRKKSAIEELLKSENPALMPGAAQLLSAIEQAAITSCVVTNSPNKLISIIREKQPLLNTIPFWITRDDYTRPKPDPECYEKAISRYCPNSDKIIGFEDSPRGLKALKSAKAKAVLINPIPHPIAEQMEALQFDSFHALPDTFE